MPTAPPPLDLLVFNAQPGATLLLSPEWVIVGASDDYLAATLTQRDVIVGQYIFDAFPDNPDTPEANGVANVRASLQQVLATRQPHDMAPQHYDVPDPAHPGRFVERHWQPRHTPVLDATGEVQFIIQSVQDITARRLAEGQLRDSQAAEQAARAAAELQRQQVTELFQQAPASIAQLTGPTHVFTLVNPGYQQLVGNRPLLGLPLATAFPELIGPYLALLDQVYQTGAPYYGREVAADYDRTNSGRSERAYFNFIYQATRDAADQVTGVLIFAYDVSEQVRARQQVQVLNEELAATNQELAATNEELHATNDEFLASNAALGRAQQELQQLNQELEARVQARTRELAYAQAETEVQRQRLHQLVAEAPALIASLRGPEHVVELANEGFRAIFGGRELVGKTYREAIPEFATQPFFDRLDRVYRTGETYAGVDEPVILDRTNSGRLERTFITYTYQATRDAQGQIDGILVFCYEVTEQVLARQEREAQRRLLHELFMQAPAAICILSGPALAYELVNPNYQQIFPDRELLGRPLLDALPEIADHATYQGFRAVYDTGVSLEEKALLIPLARPGDGVLENRYFNYIQQARRNADGQIDGVLVFAFEVTDQVLARQQAQAVTAELRDANQQLVRTNVDLDNFIYTASHDLKAPISNIEGLLYLLQEELPPAVFQDAEVGPTLTRMLDAVERFKRTIGHLTEVSKLQKEHAPATTLVNLAAVVEDVRQDLTPLLQATGAKLFVDVSALPPVQFSEKNLRSIVYNLLNNAVKYHSPNRAPRVDLRAHVRPGHTVLEVHDNGLGIAEAQLPRLFTMFQRFHDHVEGTGIGLYMVQRMVENAGGRIEVYSQLGAGTTFFVFLPHGADTGTPPFPVYILS